MDSPNQQSQNPQPLEIKPITKKARLSVIIFVGIIIALLFGILSYFNILPFSNLLSHPKTQPISTSTIRTNNITSNPIKIHCPTIKGFCDEGQDIFKDQYMGLGYKLFSGSVILAAFDGTLTATTSSFQQVKDGKTVQKTFIIAYLENQDINRRAAYYFRGSIDKDGKVKKGEKIATSDGKQISIYDNSSLVFSLFDSNSTAPIIINNDIFE